MSTGAARGRSAKPQTIRPFWERINLFFLFPFQTEPLLYGIGLALSGLLVHVLVIVPEPFDYLLVGVGVMLAASRYGFKIMEQASQGQFDSSGFPNGLDSEFVNLPWKMFGISLVLGTVEGFVSAMFPSLDWLANLLISIAFPAAIATLLLTKSMWQALFPVYWLPLIGAMGWSYLVLCLFLFLLTVGAGIAAPVMLAVVGPSFIFPVLIFCLVYFGWVMCSLLGYVIYQHHEALDFQPQFRHAREPGDKAQSAAAIKQQQTSQDEAQYAELLAQGDVRTARELAYEAQRMQPDDLGVQKRYHQILLLDDNPTRLCDHAQKYLGLLMLRKQHRDAIGVIEACRSHDAKFSPESSATLIELGQYALRAHDTALCVKLINGFDKKYVGDKAIPQAYELAAKALLQAGAAKEKIQKIATVLQQRFPDHPSTQEVLWLLR